MQRQSPHFATLRSRCSPMSPDAEVSSHSRLELARSWAAKRRRARYDGRKGLRGTTGDRWTGRFRDAALTSTVSWCTLSPLIRATCDRRRPSSGATTTQQTGLRVTGVSRPPVLGAGRELADPTDATARHIVWTTPTQCEQHWHTSPRSPERAHCAHRRWLSTAQRGRTLVTSPP